MNKGHLICNLTRHNCNLITKEDRTKVRLPKRNCPLHAELSLWGSAGSSLSCFKATSGLSSGSFSFSAKQFPMSVAFKQESSYLFHWEQHTPGPRYLLPHIGTLQYQTKHTERLKLCFQPFDVLRFWRLLYDIIKRNWIGIAICVFFKNSITYSCETWKPVNDVQCT